MKKFPFHKQRDQMDCGVFCLKMIAEYHGKVYQVPYLREKSFITREGASMRGLAHAAESIGLRSLGVKIDYDTLAEKAPLPCIAHWRQRHYVVVYQIKKDSVYVADPAHGLVQYTKEEFIQGWQFKKKAGEDEGLLLLLEPSQEFYDLEHHTDDKPSGLKLLFPYLKPYKRYIGQLFLGLLVGSLIQLILPFLSQALVDYGINHQNVSFIYLVLAAQLVLFFSQTTVQAIRSWILLHIGSRINLSIVSDFLFKLMRLPIGFFDTKLIGDLLQRIDDHNRLERFLSSSSLSMIFSIFSTVIFSVVLFIYSIKILLVFLLGSVLYVIWALIFMKKRAELDFKRFDQAAENRSSLIQIINGINEIKLNNSERRHRWEWEEIRVKLFNISVKGLALSQIQDIGSKTINELKNIVISFMAALAVINGEMTLGMMLAVQYIIGQLNAPLAEFINFARSLQDARLSLDRMNEIHQVDNEEKGEHQFLVLPKERSIQMEHLTFQYGGPDSVKVLDGVSCVIPESKVTAIVGASGSGKTTLLKLLLQFYPPKVGSIKVGNLDLNNIDVHSWRANCGVVMQDGFIFGDTIARNITESDSDHSIDVERLAKAVEVANLQTLIEKLPAGLNTKIGSSGSGLSGGEKQRILIARAVYKNPEYLFFDEATSALDANNEKTIMSNLQQFFIGKTVIVVAHRLSTVKNADQIMVLDQGRLVELGDHKTLTASKGTYYQLVKNQLELGS